VAALAAVVLFVGVAAQEWKAAAGLFLLILPFAAAALWLKYARFVAGVTNRRVVIKTGLLHRRSFDLMLKQVEGVNVDQPLLGRLLGYGTLIVSGTGGKQEVFKQVSAATEFKRRLQDQIAGG
jgi:uncharacterized membrane protein YdbT with pleckstrin-like domain